MSDSRKLLSFRCKYSAYKALLRLSEKNKVSLTVLINQALLMYCDRLSEELSSPSASHPPLTESEDETT